MGGIGAAIGISVGTSLLTAGATHLLSPTQKVETGRIQDLTAPKTNYGAALPWCWGKVRVGGIPIAVAPIKEYKKKKGGKGAKVEQTEYTYTADFGVMFCECPFRPIVGYRKLYFNKQLKYSALGDQNTIDASNEFRARYLELYLGTDNQQPDPLLESINNLTSYSGIPSDTAEREALIRALGLDPATTITTPAYTRRAYASINSLPLKDYNNSLPLVDAEIDAGGGNLGQIIKDLFGLYFDETDLYTTPIDSIAVEGFAINSEAAAKNAIQNLQKAYHFDIIQSGREIKFIPLQTTRPITLIPSSDLAAHQQKTSRPQNFEIIETDPKTLPTEYAVTFLDPDKEYDTNTVYSRVQVREEQNENKITVDLPLVLTTTEAQNICDRLLYLAWLERYKYKFSLPPKYLALEPTDLIQNIFDDYPSPIKLTQVRIGANLIMQCEGIRHDTSIFDFERTIDDGYVSLETASYTVNIAVSGEVYGVTGTDGTVYTEGTDYTVSNNEINILSTGAIAEGTEIYVSTAAPAAENVPTPTITTAGDTTLKVLDIPLITDSDADWTIYLTGGGGANWTEASVYVSTDNVNYQFATILDTYGIYGVGTVGATDITVTVNAAELQSVSDADIDAGLNKALIGNEIIQFKTATLTDTNTYVLSDLTRGLRGTEWAIDTHSTDEEFVLLTGENAYLEKISASLSDLNQTRYFKALSPGQALDQVSPVVITYQGNSQKPYAPINLTATKEETGNITFTWDRRDRHAGERTDIKNFPLSERREEYQINVLNNADNELQNIVSNRSETTYYSAEQIADFGSLQTTITVKIAQVSSQIGLGNYAQATLTPSFNPAIPAITSFSPIQSQIGDTVTIYGSGLAGITVAAINGTPVNNLAVVGEGEINFVVATGTTTGFIEVTTPGGTAASSNALIIGGDYLDRATYTESTSGLIKASAIAFPIPKPITLPYTIDAADIGKELIVDNATGIVKIPDLATGFADGWGCYLSLDGTSSVTVQRVSGGTMGLLINNQLTQQGTIIIRHRTNNTWVIG